MQFRLFYHSLVSDWNHGNAHFLRGVVAELLGRGHQVRVFEPRDGWSRQNLMREPSCDGVEEFRRAFPHLCSELYDPASFDAGALLDGANVVIVHEWTDARVLARIAEHRTRGANYGLLFHDTHHRALSDPDALAEMALERFDGVLAFGESLATRYRQRGWGRRVWVWHEAADTRVFYPRSAQAEPASRADARGDLVWIGNWGDDERVRELNEFLLEPVRELRIGARVHGVRYPPDALARLHAAGIEYAGWIPNCRVPEVFARFRVTVHIPRRPYVSLLPGIPTIRPFEALACGIPLVSAPWNDVEELFRPGDFVMAANGREMACAIRRVLHDEEHAAELCANGLATIRRRHTCGHRVDELLAHIGALIQAPASAPGSLASQEVS
jgi:spore maturation protein CgeB